MCKHKATQGKSIQSIKYNCHCESQENTHRGKFSIVKMPSNSNFQTYNQNMPSGKSKGHKKPALIRLDSTGQDTPSHRSHSFSPRVCQKLASSSWYTKSTNTVQPKSFRHCKSSFLQLFGINKNNMTSESLDIPGKTVHVGNQSKQDNVQDMSDALNFFCKNSQADVEMGSKVERSNKRHSELQGLRKSCLEKLPASHKQNQTFATKEFKPNCSFTNWQSLTQKDSLVDRCSKKWPHSQLFLNRDKHEQPDKMFSQCMDSVASITMSSTPCVHSAGIFSTLSPPDKNSMRVAVNVPSVPIDTFQEEMINNCKSDSSNCENLEVKQHHRESQMDSGKLLPPTYCNVNKMEMDSFSNSGSCQIDIKCLSNIKDSTSWDNLYDDAGNINVNVVENLDFRVKHGNVPVADNTDNSNCESAMSCEKSNVSDHSDPKTSKETQIENNNKKDTCKERNKIPKADISVLYIRPQKKCKPKRKRKSKGLDTCSQPDSNQEERESGECKYSTSPSFEIHFLNEVSDIKHWVVSSETFCDKDGEFISDWDSSSDDSDECDFFSNGLEDLLCGNMNSVGFNMTVSVKPISIYQEDDHSITKAVKDANVRWEKNYTSDSKTKSKCLPKSTSKVHFPSDCNLSKVHNMIAWSYAYQSARKGQWEEYARDTQRFRRRIEETEKVLAPVLEQSHRQQIFNKLQTTN